MTTLAQRKALEFVFCDSITDGLWDRVIYDKLSEEDNIWDVFSGQDIKTLVKDLSINFQEIFDVGYLQGVNLMKGQSVK